MTALPQAWPLGMRVAVAAAYVGGESNLRELEEHYGLVPTIRRNRNTTYSRHSIDAVWARAEAEGWNVDVEASADEKTPPKETTL